jgi:hypothetical protein
VLSVPFFRPTFVAASLSACPAERSTSNPLAEGRGNTSSRPGWCPSGQASRRRGRRWRLAQFHGRTRGSGRFWTKLCLWATPPSITRDGACVAHGPVPSSGRQRFSPPTPELPRTTAVRRGKAGDPFPGRRTGSGACPSPPANPESSKPVKRRRTLPAAWGPEGGQPATLFVPFPRQLPARPGGGLGGDPVRGTAHPDPEEDGPSLGPCYRLGPSWLR